MHLVTAEEMRKLDQHAINVIGIPAAVLMETAGKAVADHIAEHYRRGKWLILAGKGNNGGDGLAAARHLTEHGFSVDIVFAEDPALFTGEMAMQVKIAASFPLRTSVFAPDSINWRDYDGIVDALLGTGSKGAPRGAYAALIREACASGLPVVSIDIPSGLDADTGKLHDPCVSAQRTITLAFMKRGLAVRPGMEAAGKVVVARIGIPVFLAEQFGISVFLVDETLLAEHLGINPHLPRRADTHKGTYGHVLIAAGSGTMGGAGQLCAKAALRAGCGLATWLTPQSVAVRTAGAIPEVMTIPVTDHGSGQWANETLDLILAQCRHKNALIAGPGLGRFERDTDWLRRLWAESEVPLVLDADALNMLAEAQHFRNWPKRNNPVILTPHPGEMARLTGKSAADVQLDRIECARQYAIEHGVTVVLKGSRTVTATPDGEAFVNTTGNPGMATAGAGDVLAGVIGSLLAQGCTAKQAAALGAYLHGKAGDRAAAKRNFPFSLIAGDIIDNL